MLATQRSGHPQPSYVREAPGNLRRVIYEQPLSTKKKPSLVDDHLNDDQRSPGCGHSADTSCAPSPSQAPIDDLIRAPFPISVSACDCDMGWAKARETLAAFFRVKDLQRHAEQKWTLLGRYFSLGSILLCTEHLPISKTSLTIRAKTAS